MKIGIMGLQSHQIADLNTRQFPGMVVECYDKKGYAKEQVAAFVRNNDKVILVMNGRVSQSVAQMVVSTKKITMTGAVSSLVRRIEQLAQDHGIKAPEPVQDSYLGMLNGISKDPIPKAVVELAEQESEQVVGMDLAARMEERGKVIAGQDLALATSISNEDRALATDGPSYLELLVIQGRKCEGTIHEWLTSVRKALNQRPPPALGDSMPRSHKSQYLWIEALRDSSNAGRSKYWLVEMASPGDVLRFSRPENVTLDVWRVRMNALRHRWTTLEVPIHTEVHYYETYCDIQIIVEEDDHKGRQRIVERVAQLATAQEVFRAVAEMAPQKFVTADERAEEFGQAFVPQRVVSPEETGIPKLEESTPFTLAPPGQQIIPTDMSERLWLEASVAAIRAGDGATLAASKADELVKQYRQRYVKE